MAAFAVMTTPARVSGGATGDFVGGVGEIGREEGGNGVTGGI